MEKLTNEFDISMMKIAIEEAKLAAEEDEVPVGAVIARDGMILARCHNMLEGNKCATHHAEILAIEECCRALGGWRLPGVTLYITLEPCAMCTGAIINARIPRVVFGAKDLRFGAMGSLVDLPALPFNHKPEILGGVLEDQCVEVLRSYFRKKREK
jgi:tRNA(adenine34) deaminase